MSNKKLLEFKIEYLKEQLQQEKTETESETDKGRVRRINKQNDRVK